MSRLVYRYQLPTTPCSTLDSAGQFPRIRIRTVGFAPYALRQVAGVPSNPHSNDSGGIHTAVIMDGGRRAASFDLQGRKIRNPPLPCGFEGTILSQSRVQVRRLIPMSGESSLNISLARIARSGNQKRDGIISSAPLVDGGGLRQTTKG